MRCSSAQENYLRILLREAFSHRYVNPLGRVEENQIARMSREEAFRWIDHLKAAKARGWSSWESTEEGQREIARKEMESQTTQKRVAILRQLKAEGYSCNCAEQELDGAINRAKCPLHARFDSLLK